jgi:hypothetical protein
MVSHPDRNTSVTPWISLSSIHGWWKGRNVAR